MAPSRNRELYPDNIVIVPKTGDIFHCRVPVVDWPHARVGASWVDPGFFAPSVAMQNGLSPEELFAKHPHGRKADPDALTTVIGAVAGFFARRGLQPAPPGLPTLRPFQAAQGEVARSWLARRTGWR
jgi:hypothetical protein